MKKTIHLLMSTVVLFLFACSSDRDILPDPLADDAALKGPHPHATVIMVYPGGGDDTQALTDAFAAADAAGPGSVVQLAEGTFTIGFIEIRNFTGFFRGAGPGLSIITNLENLPCLQAIYDNLNPALMKFIGGDVKVSDMSFTIKDGRPCGYDPEYLAIFGDLVAILCFSDYREGYTPPLRHIRARVNNVHFYAGYDDGNDVQGFDFNTTITVYFGPDLWVPGPDDLYGSVDIAMTNCVSEHLSCGFDGFGIGPSSTMLCENNVMKKGAQQVFLAGLLGSKTIIRNNRFEESIYQDIFIDDWDYGYWPYAQSAIGTSRPVVQISNNTCDNPTDNQSIVLLNDRRVVLGETYAVLADVKGNRIKTAGGGTAIYTSCAADAKIWNNSFSGQGSIGVFIDGDPGLPTWAENVTLNGNNYFGASYSDAAVYLGEYSRNCTVVGVAGDRVIDLGTDNKIIGTKAGKKGPASLHKNARMMSLRPMPMRPAR